MQGSHIIGLAAAPTIEVVRRIAADQLDAPTPCRHYDTRQLINHLLFWVPSLAGAARKETVVPPGASEGDADLTGGDWSGRLTTQLGSLAREWGDPAAWDGQTRLGGPDPLPAPMIGGMVCTELLLHGWDLARATGQKPEWDERVLVFAHRELVATAERGRQMGAYGPEVAVDPEAPLLDRLLGLSGRDPAWPE